MMNTELQPSAIELSPIEHKPYGFISKMRDAKHRPLIRSLADVLNIIESRGIEPIGDLFGRSNGLQCFAGRVGSFCRVEGETATERFGIAIPFAECFFGTDANGKRRKVRIDWFDGARIAFGNGCMTVKPKWLFKNVQFRISKLPFNWSETNFRISALVAQFANETGLSQCNLGRELPTSYVDFPGLAQIEIAGLDPVVEFVRSRWRESSTDIPPPSRETIAAALAALSMRSRARGRHAVRR
jgi:hypothetical protein